MAYQVLIVEDDPMAQQLLAAYIQQSINYQLVDTVSSADFADLYCQRHPIDLILMDIHTAMHASGLDAAARIKTSHPSIRIIIVTSMVDPHHLKRAKEIGVDSFWYKDTTVNLLRFLWTAPWQGSTSSRILHPSLSSAIFVPAICPNGSWMSFGNCHPVPPIRL